MLGKAGAVVGIATGLGGSRAQTSANDSAEDTLGELLDLLDNVTEEVINAQRAIELLADTEGFEEFLGESESDTTGSDPEFDSDPALNETPSGQAAGTATGIDLDEVDDELVINGVPLGQKESLDSLTDAERDRLEGVRINGVVISEEAPSQPPSGNRTPNSNENSPGTKTVSGNQTTATPGTGGGNGNETTSTPTPEANGGGSRTSQVIVERRLTAAETAVETVENEADGAVETVEDFEPFGLDIVEEEILATRRLLLEVQQTAETVQETLTNDIGAAADTMERLNDRLVDRIDGVEEAMEETENIEVS